MRLLLARILYRLRVQNEIAIWCRSDPENALIGQTDDVVLARFGRHWVTVWVVYEAYREKRLRLAVYKIPTEEILYATVWK